MWILVPGAFVMHKVLVVEPSYREHAAVSIRIKYFVEALKNVGLNVGVYDYRLGSKVSRLVKYLFPSIPKDLRKRGQETDIILTSSPPPLLAITVSLLEKKYVIDVRDIWEEYAQQIYPTFLVKKIVSKYFRALIDANAVVVTTDSMAKYYKEKLGIDPLVIPNGTDTGIIRCNKSVSRDPNLMVVLADFNTPYQNLEPLLEAITLVKNVKLLLIGSGKHLSSYLSLAEKLGVADRVKSVGHVPYNELSKYLCEASIGVVGRPFDFNPEYLYTIPTKIYDYLAAGLPVLAYGPQYSEMRKFVENNRVGIYLVEPTSREISEAVSSLIAKADDMRLHVLEVAGRYDRKTLGITLADVISKL